MTPRSTRAKERRGDLMTYSLAVRLAGYVRRRAWLPVIRVRHPKARFGALCDIRRGFRLTMAPGASVRIGPRCSLDRMLTLEASGAIDVGADTVIGHHCTIASRSSVVIGSECLIGELVSIRDHDHAVSSGSLPMRLQGDVVSPVRIGDNVWLGAKVTVLRGITIGDGAVVGANAVVACDLPAGCVAVGVPARIIRRRAGG